MTGARDRRLSFGPVAELYDRARPSYPAELIDDVLQIAGVGPGDHVLEVGAGTGKATVLFAARGLSILALEPDAEMAGVLRRNCATFPNVRIEVTDFERCDDSGEPVPLIYSAQAWHWTAPELRYARAGAALKRDGLLAAFWNRVDWAGNELRAELEAAYRQAAPQLAPDGPMHPAVGVPLDRAEDWQAEIDAADGFDRAEVRTYRWQGAYTTNEYLELLGTHSDHLLLSAAERRVLLAAVADVLDARGGEFRFDHVTRLCLARKR